jgi:phenylacetate-coenzyme A ligase PaaK-like adenylate-forming protein
MVNKYSDIIVPDDEKLQALGKLGEIQTPYTESKENDQLFIQAMNEINDWHISHCDFFARFFGRVEIKQLDDLKNMPFIHANFFKYHEIKSIKDKDIFLHLTSSGTSGQKSQVFFDKWSIHNAQRMVQSIFNFYEWVTPEKVNYLLFSYEPRPGFKVGTSFTDNYLCDFAPANKVIYAFKNTGKGKHDFDPFGCIRALQDFARDGLPVRIFGFPAFMYFTLERMKDMGIPDLELNPSSMTFFGGGWKGQAEKQVDKKDLYNMIETQLGISNERCRDGYGSVEHCIPYIECSHHQFHRPIWSRFFVRDVKTLKTCSFGEKGYLQFIAPYLTSVPAQSVLMGDLASIHPGSDCPCDLTTPYFVLHGRAGTSKNKSCAIAAAELLKEKSL